MQQTGRQSHIPEPEQLCHAPKKFEHLLLTTSLLERTTLPHGVLKIHPLVEQHQSLCEDELAQTNVQPKTRPLVEHRFNLHPNAKEINGI